MGVLIKSSSGLWDIQAYFPKVDSDRGFAPLGQDQTAAGYTFLASGTGWLLAVRSVFIISEPASHSSSTRNVQLCCHSLEPGSSGSWNDQVQVETDPCLYVRMAVLLCGSHAEPSAHCLIRNVSSAPMLPASPASPATPGSYSTILWGL